MAKDKRPEKTSLRDGLMATLSKLARNLGGGANKAMTKEQQRQTEQKKAN